MNQKIDCTELTKQINRISGQVGGVKKMIEEGRNPNDIIQQISAARAALSRLGVDLLKEESNLCLKQKNVKDRQKSFETLVTNFFKMT